MYTIEFTRDATKQLKKLPRKVLIRLLKKVEELSSNPKPHGVKSLKGNLSPYYRVRSGDYRILYAIENDKLVILIVKVAHRKDVYDL